MRRCCLGEQEAGQPRDVDIGLLDHATDSCPKAVDLDVTNGEPGASKVRCTERVASVEHDSDAGAFLVQVGEKFELDLGDGFGSVCATPPDSFVVRFELCVPQGDLEPGCVDRPGGNFEVDLHVDIGGSGVGVRRGGAEQFWDESTEYDELGACAVVMHDADQCSFGSLACST